MIVTLGFVALVLFGMFVTFKERNGEDWEPSSTVGKALAAIAGVVLMVVALAVLLGNPGLWNALSGGQR